MKRIYLLSVIAVLVITIPFPVVKGQQKEDRKNIRVVVKEGQDKKVILDTLLNKNMTEEESVLSDGNVYVFANRTGKDSVENDPYIKTVIISASTKSDNPDEEDMKREITEWTMTGKGSGDKILIINDDKTIIERKEGDPVVYDIIHGDNDLKGSESERTKYVINKDGLIITIEGDDYKKVKDLSKVIEENTGNN